MKTRVVLRRVGGDLSRHPAAAVALGLAFLILAALYASYRMTAAAADASLKAAGWQAHLIVYLEDGAGETRRDLEAALARLDGVERVRFVSGAEALARLRQRLGDRSRLLDGAEEALLPASLEVSLVRGADRASRARQLAWRLARHRGVTDVDLLEPREDERLGEWALLARWLRRAFLATCVLGGGAMLLFASGALRGRRRAEMEVLLAVGFTRTAAFLPAVLSSAVAAVAGAALGLLVWRLGGGQVLARTSVASLVDTPAATLVWREWVLGLAGAALLGSLAGLVAVRIPDAIDRA